MLTSTIVQLMLFAIDQARSGDKVLQGWCVKMVRERIMMLSRYYILSTLADNFTLR